MVVVTRSVINHVVRLITVILHLIVIVSRAVVYGGNIPDTHIAHIETTVHGKRQLLFGQCGESLHPPTLVDLFGESCSRFRRDIVKMRRSISGKHTSSCTEPKVIGAQPVGQLKRFKRSIGIESGLILKRVTVSIRNIFGHHPYKSTGKIGRQFGRRRFIHHHVINK